jgi:hypothetical protein
MTPLASLLGTWAGNGHGEYPTIEAFDYVESVTISHVGKPFFSYAQATRDAGTGQPLHSEAGYWRMPSPDTVELVIAQPSGIVDVEVGQLRDGVVLLRSTAVALTPTAKEVTDVEREWRFESPGILLYTLKMAAVGVGLTLHLTAALHRQSQQT